MCQIYQSIAAFARTRAKTGALATSGSTVGASGDFSTVGGRLIHHCVESRAEIDSVRRCAPVALGIVGEETIMKRCATLTILALLISSAHMARAQEKDLSAAVEGSKQFAVDLYARLRQSNKGENIFFSPFSISTALAMTFAGARAQTAAEMAKVLHFTLPPDKLHPAYGSLLKAANDATESGGNTLAVANALWGQRGYEFLPSFLDLTRKIYGAGLNGVDFAKDCEGARGAINGWAEKQTLEKIKDLIPRGALRPETLLVLTNAIYFKGTWVTRFAKANTASLPFTLLGDQEIHVPLMHETALFGYAEDSDLQALELSYQGKKISMVVLLPKEKSGLSALEDKLSASWLDQRLGSMAEEKVSVYLPKFTTTLSFMLGETLKSMGMPLAFSGHADFSGMSAKPDLKISEVIHKAFVDVNEEGTEAAAATAVGMRRMVIARPAKPIPEFRADHPFLFLIRDKTTGAILFLGRVMDPR
jgi:serpin B